MIVRDAEQHVARCIQSALPFVDKAVIIDTGCIDNTMPIAREALGELPCERFESEWVGHAHNRSELLEKVKASGADYCLMLDADMELVQEQPLRELTADEYMIPIRDRGLVYPLPLLTSTRKRFRYSGVAHAYLECLDGPTEGQVLHEIALIDHGGGGHREGKIERDAELLAAEVGKNPADARSWFYLAQSYRDLGEVHKAIAAYKMRATLGGWGEEVYNSLYQAGTLLCAHVNYYDGAKLLISAAEMKQNRAEALRALAGCTTSVADKLQQPLDEVLFVEPGAYRHHATRPVRPEVEEIFFHRYTPQPGAVVVELGAAEGTETPLLSQLVGPNGTVLAVEPHPATFERLRSACSELANVTLLNCAVAAKRGHATISDDPVSWHNRLTDDGSGIKVETRTLDAVTRSFERIDLLKVNIEGSEAEVLERSPKTLAKTQNVVVSCHDFVGTPTKQRARAALEQAGFDVAAHDDPLIIEDGHNGRCLGDYLYAKRLLRADQVSAVIVTRGDVDLSPVLEVLPFKDIHIWDNSKRPHDLKTYGRVRVLEECENEIIFSVDDDVIFTAFDQLLAAYEPGLLVCNMDDAWTQPAGYGDWHHLTGAGSIYDRSIPVAAVERYLAHHPYDDEFLTWCDAIVGTLAPGKRVDLGYEVRDFSDGPGRLWTTPGNPERKWRIINRCRVLMDEGTTQPPQPTTVPRPAIATLKPRREPRVDETFGLDARDVSAIIVTRGDVDLAPVLETLPYGDIVVWNNSVIDPTWNGGPAIVAKKQGPVTILGGCDYKVFGRYAAIPYTKNPVIFWVDDDVLFSEHESLLSLYEPGKLVTNMDAAWAEGYENLVALLGAGSLCDAWLPAKVWNTYLAVHPWDDEVLVEADFAFGTLAPSTVADLGFEVRDFADRADRLYRQPGQTGRKWRMIHRCRQMLEQKQAA